jgi:SsrA-binding protein
VKKKAKHQPKKITNRRAKFDYELGDGFVAGIALTGRETKALRLGHGHLQGAYITVKDGQLWLINATIASAPGISIEESEQTRSRKLLAKRRQIDELIAAKQQGMTIVPLEILTQGRYIKVRLALGKGKKRYDKRETLKKRDQMRAIQQKAR